MDFPKLYSNIISELINTRCGSANNTIFVILGQTDLIDTNALELGLADKATFSINGTEKVFSKEWFTHVFSVLSQNKEYHILSYAQFSYLSNYISSDFFSDRIVFIRDNLRLVFPLLKEEFIEESRAENIEERSVEIPIYQAEQIRVGDDFFYSVKLPAGEFEYIDMFSNTKSLIENNSEGLEIIDVSTDQYALDLFINNCIIHNNFNRDACIKIHSKQSLSSSILDAMSIVNYLLGLYGGSLFKRQQVILVENFTYNDKIKSLLKKYWGLEAEFRNLQVYSNPNLGNQLTEISQGLIVETIIAEYTNAQQSKKSRDLFLTAPTGAGKSLLFQLPAFYISEQGDVSIIVSPLIALMKDQVSAIINERKFKKVAYLNSELSLTDRDRIIEDCKYGRIDILYMSPELLLSYDIAHFIGDRRLGLFVVDEAHLITTWGRDFRVDYWFLGNHIRKIRKYHNLTFPMVAVTATAVYGGTNDMVFDSIDSLAMHDPHIFIGQVKRLDITFVINNYKKFESNYEKNKLNQTLEFIKSINTLGLKTLVYTPYTKHVVELIHKLTSEKLDIAASYYGSLPPDQKEISFISFKTGQKNIMVSTKAFGMGVDISDIEVVYHHAPSGLLPDYVQEVGRVARKSSVKGFAALNYSASDQWFTKALHGMSALKHIQIKEVLKKIYKVYLLNNKSRNLLLSVDDFGYIFENAKDLDQKVLTALMMIEKDYLAKYRFNVIIARPKKLFVRVYARISDSDLNSLQAKYTDTFKYIDSLKNGYNIIELNLDELWYKSFNSKSFPSIKRMFYSGTLLNNEKINLVPQLKITFELFLEHKTALDSLNVFFTNLCTSLANLGEGFFTQKELAKELKRYIIDDFQCNKISQFILSSYSSFLIQPGIIESNTFLQRKKDVDEYKYRIFNNRYLGKISSLKQKSVNLFKGSNKISTKYVTAKEENSIDYIRLGYILDLLELGTFEIKGGESPMIFIRINDPYRIDRDSSDSRYMNNLLSKTLDRHYLSNQIFDHFFLRSFTNEERWDFIEDFFLGFDIDSLLETYKGYDGNDVDIVNYLESAATSLNVEGKETCDSFGIHIFKPKFEGFYYSDSLLTIQNADSIQTMKIREWIAQDSVLLHKVMQEYKITIDKESFSILLSKLKNNHIEYFRAFMQLNMRIKFKGYPGLVKASVPYEYNPVDFYKWWCENKDEVVLSFKDKISLFLRVYELNPVVLKKKHMKMIN